MALRTAGTGGMFVTVSFVVSELQMSLQQSCQKGQGSESKDYAVF
jgi:hypothetical protein